VGILIDPGAWTNIGGKKAVRQLAEVAARSGHPVSQQLMDKPLTIQGVGNGFNECKCEVTLPIATLDSSGEVAELNLYETPTVEAPGDELPLILGLRSMSEKNGVLNMRAGAPTLTFPGPGGSM